MFGTYQRLGVHVWATSREVIKAASRKLRPECRYARAHRVSRHAFYRTMLAYHDRGVRLAVKVTTGNLSE